MSTILRVFDVPHPALSSKVEPHKLEIIGYPLPRQMEIHRRVDTYGGEQKGHSGYYRSLERSETRVFRYRFANEAGTRAGWLAAVECFPGDFMSAGFRYDRRSASYECDLPGSVEYEASKTFGRLFDVLKGLRRKAQKQSEIVPLEEIIEVFSFVGQ